MTLFLALVAAFLVGAGGLAAESLLLSSAGLALGYGAASAIGLAAYVAGWAIGGWHAGVPSRAARRAADDSSRAIQLTPEATWLVLGAIALCAPLAALSVLLAGGSGWFGEGSAGSSARALAAALAIAGAGWIQGQFLPRLAHLQPQSRVFALLAVNLLGSVVGSLVLHTIVLAYHGRIVAALVAGACSCAGALVAASASRRGPRGDRLATQPCGAACVRAAAPPSSQTSALTSAALAAIVGLVTAATILLEWIGVRLGSLWLGGMQPALVAVLAASLVALAAGSLLAAPLLPLARVNAGRALAIVSVVCAAGALWPWLADDALRALFPPSARAVESLPAIERLVRALVLVGPMLLGPGMYVPVLHAGLVGDSGVRLGRIYLHEALGAALGAPLAHFWIVPHFGTGGALAAVIACVALANVAVVLGTRSFPRERRATTWLALSFAACALACGIAARSATPILRSPPLANPALQLRWLEEDCNFAVAVVDDGLGGERTLLTDGFRAAGTGREYRYMRVLGHLPILLHPHPERVAILALGTGTTLGAVTLHSEVREIDVLEISAAVVRAAPWFVEKNLGALAAGWPALGQPRVRLPDARANGNAPLPGADSSTGPSRGADSGTSPSASVSDRVRVRLGDGRATLAATRGRYDVLTMEPLLPDSPFAVYLYTPEFYAVARRALAPGGLVCQWVPPHALEPETFDAVLEAFQSSFEWTGVWRFGTQVVLVGGDAAPVLVRERFRDLDPALARALVELGLESAGGLAARYVTQGLRNEGGGRVLSDEDPWIVHRPRRSGAVLLLDLPENLATLLAARVSPPLEWNTPLASADFDRRAGVLWLARARELYAREEAALRGVDPRRAPGRRPLESGPGARDDGLTRLDAQTCAQALAHARELAPGDPEIADLEEEILFVSNLRRGVALLGQGAGGEALDSLTLAAQARPERGDVHLYVALALQRLHSPAAVRALERALRTCPGILETDAGRRVLTLGLQVSAPSDSGR